MSREVVLRHEFVQHIPPVLAEHTVYVSVAYATAVHRCCCGCGGEVVTPLSPTDWALVFDGETVSLEPSIGNWGFPCRSHYWVRRGRVRWAERWTDEEVAHGKARDRRAKARFFRRAEPAGEVACAPAVGADSEIRRQGPWQRVQSRMRRIVAGVRRHTQLRQ